jgi:hypothetical protein
MAASFSFVPHRIQKARRDVAAVDVGGVLAVDLDDGGEPGAVEAILRHESFKGRRAVGVWWGRGRGLVERATTVIVGPNSKRLWRSISLRSATETAGGALLMQMFLPAPSIAGRLCPDNRKWLKVAEIRMALLTIEGCGLHSPAVDHEMPSGHLSMGPLIPATL